MRFTPARFSPKTAILSAAPLTFLCPLLMGMATQDHTAGYTPGLQEQSAPQGGELLGAACPVLVYVVRAAVGASSNENKIKPALQQLGCSHFLVTRGRAMSKTSVVRA